MGAKSTTELELNLVEEPPSTTTYQKASLSAVLPRLLGIQSEERVLRKYKVKNTNEKAYFSSLYFIQWLTDEKLITERSEGITIANLLISLSVFIPLNGSLKIEGKKKEYFALNKELVSSLDLKQPFRQIAAIGSRRTDLVTDITCSADEVRKNKKIKKKEKRGRSVSLGDNNSVEKVARKKFLRPFAERPRGPRIFGSSLEDIMSLQKEKEPSLEIPIVLKSLTGAIEHLKGFETEGIFRIPGAVENVKSLKEELDLSNFDEVYNYGVYEVADCLKWWLRELEQPLIPNEFYESCILCAKRHKHEQGATETRTIEKTSGTQNMKLANDRPKRGMSPKELHFGEARGSLEASKNEKKAEKGEIKKSEFWKEVENIPSLNLKVLVHLIGFLKQMSKEEVCSKTKMAAENLAMIFSPILFLCPNPDLLMVNSPLETFFVHKLITTPSYLSRNLSCSLSSQRSGA